MKRLIYIIFAVLCVSCSQEIFPEENLGRPVYSGSSSEISPVSYVQSTDLPPAATKAMINISTVSAMEANVLRIDEKIDEADKGLYTFGSWEDAYLIEANVAAPQSQSQDQLRSMTLNPVQAYSYKVVDSDTTCYHTRMISWYPRTCTLYKNEEGKAPVMHFSDFKTVDHSVYSIEDNDVVLNFKNLDGSKDVMVSNIVEGQHWHKNKNDEYVNELDRYTYPFGYNQASPAYTNYLTYKHYLSAVKVYAYAKDSQQAVSMWGTLRSVVVRNQPSELSVRLPKPDDMNDAVINGRKQENSLDYGDARFSGDTDFPLIKTPMYESETNDMTDQDVAEDAPNLKLNERVYLGYALVKPCVADDQVLELDVHTDAGVLSLSVPMKQTKKAEDGQDTGIEIKIQPGYIYHLDINFNTQGAIADFVLQSDDTHYYDLSASSELSETVRDYKYANTYIIHPEIKRYLNNDNTDYDYYDGYAFLATTVGSATAQIYPEFSSDRTTKSIEPVRAGLLWESSPGLITHVEYLYDYIRFRVQPPEVKSGDDWVHNDNYKEGNAVIAAYDSQRKILWSWHIWVTDKPKEVYYTVAGHDKPIILLDRNLGATAASTSESTAQTSYDKLHETYGLYYQWGRKDPSMGAPGAYYRPQSTATYSYYDYYGMEWKYAGVVTMDRPGIRDGVENPMYLVLPTDFSMTTYQYDWMYTNIDNLWGDYSEKTIYDPCPFGYMTPQDEISTLFASSNPVRVSGNGMTINGTVKNADNQDVSYTSFFPYAGYKGVDKGVSSLSTAWRYVGAKGDYMSAKIEENGHRSRTYISDTYSWTEYGADADNDGDGDASRTYNSYVNADDMANRRTAASVRCVSMQYGLASSLKASFVGDRRYAFVGDGDIIFTYNITTLGNAKIKSAVVDLNGEEIPDNKGVVHSDSEVDSKTGTISFGVPENVGNGLARYRLVTESNTGVVSRVSHVLRLFEIVSDDVIVDGTSIKEDGYKCTSNQKHSISFNLRGIESDFTVVVNGVVATRTTTASAVNGIAVMKCEIQADPGVNIPGHIHIQIIDADGNLACEKSYSVDMDAPQVQSYVRGDKVTSARNLEGGGLYMFCSQGSYYNYRIKYDESTNKLTWVKYNSSDEKLDSEIDASMVFRYHRDDTQGGGVSSSYPQSAGAWYSPAADVDADAAGPYLQENFSFGPEATAVYTTCVTQLQSTVLYLRKTGQYFYFNNSNNPNWGSYGQYYHYRWDVYEIDVQ